MQQHPTRLTDQIDRLNRLTGDGTELISIAHPPGKTLQSLRNRLQAEYASAEHIQADTTRKRVQKALNRADRIASRYRETPDTGIAMYIGVVDGELHSTVFDGEDLPKPISESQYRCAATFDPSPIQDIIEPSTSYGLVVVERGQAIIGELRGDSITTIQALESQVMGKTRAGGQSAPRFERERARQTDEFYQEVAEITGTAFLSNDKCTIDGLLIGGTLATAKQFERSSHLDHRLENAILGVYSVEYATERGLEQLVDAAQTALKTKEQEEAQDNLDEFYSRLANPDPVTYGRDSVEQAIRYGAVETILVSNQLDSEVFHELGEEVEQFGGTVIEIPTGTERGSAFLQTFGGIGALLRFHIN